MFCRIYTTRKRDGEKGHLQYTRGRYVDGDRVKFCGTNSEELKAMVRHWNVFSMTVMFLRMCDLWIVHATTPAYSERCPPAEAVCTFISHKVW